MHINISNEIKEIIMRCIKKTQFENEEGINIQQFARMEGH